MKLLLFIASLACISLGYFYLDLVVKRELLESSESYFYVDDLSERECYKLWMKEMFSTDHESLEDVFALKAGVSFQVYLAMKNDDYELVKRFVADFRNEYTPDEAFTF